MRTSARIVAFLTLATLAAGCGRKLGIVAIANQPPTVQMHVERAQTLERTRVSRDVTWSASDPDGSVDHYLVAMNPASVDRVDDSWHAVRETRRAILARPRGLAALDATPQPESLQVLAVRAVDDQGAVSAPAYRAFWGENLAPVVTITSPFPSHLVQYSMPPTLRITWAGFDPDGANPTRLAKYKFRLFSGNEIDQFLRLGGLNLLNQLYAPAFATWDSVPGDSLGHTFRNLTLGVPYLFAITGFDADGNYDPIFSFDKNVLRFTVTGANGGPRISVANPWLQHTFQFPSSEPDSFSQVTLDAPAGEPVPMTWVARPQIGAQTVSYRWAVDILDIHDETPRHGRPDLDHWSAWSPTTTSATVPAPRGPHAGSTQRLFIEAADNLGFVTVAVVRIRYVPIPLDRSLLIVDDTRRAPDIVHPFYPDSIRLPTGPWPAAAELDTFLFARGGFPWQKYPSGTLSPTGIFAGYDFDTLGTRTASTDKSVPLSVLTRYRHVIWMVDDQAALSTRPPCALRYMSQLGSEYIPGQADENTLVLYIRAGGQVWLLGGGVATATLITGRTPTDHFTSANGLTAGALMYDEAHWRSSISRSSLVSGPIGATGFPGAPPLLERRVPGADPLPPLRNSASYYPSHITVEYLDEPNEILEPVHPASKNSPMASVLDTLYQAPVPAYGFQFANLPCMTRYHGAENVPLIFSGFDLWSFKRAECAQLVDAILQGEWGLTRGVTAANARAGPMARPGRLTSRR